MPAFHANALEAPFSHDGVKNAISVMPSGRAPGPNSFSRLLFKLCWEVIAEDVLAALNLLHQGNFQNFRRLNGSMLILLPTKENPP